MTDLFLSSYAGAPRRQVRGNLHAHSLHSDGLLSPQALVDVYASLGYGFLCLSDHDFLTNPQPLDPRGMTLVPGSEITAGGSHLQHVNAAAVIEPDPDRQAVIDAIAAGDGFAVMNHPNYGVACDHWPQAELARCTGYLGLEIYNGVTLRAEGNPLAADRWDMLLSRGRRLWGFGNDDTHIPADIGVAWNMVFADQRDADGILDAMRRGRFYVSTGVTLDHIEIQDGVLTVEGADVQGYRVFGEYGRLIAEQAGPRLAYGLEAAEDALYLRVEGYGARGRAAWTQPFFRP